VGADLRAEGAIGQLGQPHRRGVPAPHHQSEATVVGGREIDERRHGRLGGEIVERRGSWEPLVAGGGAEFVDGPVAFERLDQQQRAASVDRQRRTGGVTQLCRGIGSSRRDLPCGPQPGFLVLAGALRAEQAVHRGPREAGRLDHLRPGSSG
jgi:hypothetical protein